MDENGRNETNTTSTSTVSLASFPDSTPQLFIALCNAIKSWGVESGNEAKSVQKLHAKLCLLTLGRG